MSEKRKKEKKTNEQRSNVVKRTKHTKNVYYMLKGPHRINVTSRMYIYIQRSSILSRNFLK